MNNLIELKNWYEKLTEVNLDKLDLLYAENVFFKDPFNEIVGSDKLRKIFKHMFKTLEDPRFFFIDTIEQSDSAFITWDFIFKVKGKVYKIHGSSHLKYNNEKKIIYHRDYWDVGEELMLKLPFIKSLYALFRKKMAST